MDADNPAQDAGPNDAGVQGSPGGELSLASLAAAADPVLAALVAGVHKFHSHDGGATAHGEAAHYDGHVALALDADALPGIDNMLDLLISSHDLFEVPAIDSAAAMDDVAAT